MTRYSAKVIRICDKIHWESVKKEWPRLLWSTPEG